MGPGAGAWTVDDFLALSWEDDGVPVVEPGPLSPIVADPTVLFPEETPDGRWHLLAHTAWGIRDHSSADGVGWRTGRLLLRHAMRAFVRPHGSGFVLVYERYRPWALPLTILPRRPRWRSRIELRTSPDLRHWSGPTVLVEPTMPWARDPEYGDSVSNPCLVGGPEGLRLYHSAGLVHVPDCGFEEPRVIALAEAATGWPAGPWRVRPEPVIDPRDDALPGVVGAGAVTVLRLTNGWVALQNKIYDDAGGRSRSALFLLRSHDGVRWKPARADPLLAPSGAGWRSSHIYACDVRFRPADGRWHVYYNARDGWRATEGRERIGRLVSVVP